MPNESSCRTLGDCKQGAQNQGAGWSDSEHPTLHSLMSSFLPFASHWHRIHAAMTQPWHHVALPQPASTRVEALTFPSNTRSGCRGPSLLKKMRPSGFTLPTGSSRCHSSGPLSASVSGVTTKRMAGEMAALYSLWEPKRVAP